jgi:hypothetical protein
VQRWALEPPVLRAELILRLQKYRDMARVPRAIREAAEAVAVEASGLASPEAVLWRGPISRVDPSGAVTLAGIHHFHSAALARLLAHASEAYVVLLTLGDALEERVRSMFEERLLLEGLLMDTAGWAAIELLVRDVRRRLIEQERPAGRSVTHRLGPGHRDWPVEEQVALVRIFGETSLPVSLSESVCMLPQKSISAVYGIVPAK